VSDAAEASAWMHMPWITRCCCDRPTTFTQRRCCPSLQPERGTDSDPACWMWMVTRRRSAISP